MEGYVDVIDVNSVIGVFFDRHNDFVDIGWQEIELVKKEIDTTLVNLEQLNSEPFPTDKIRKKLLNDALLYLSTNSRKKDLYQELANEIGKMKSALEKKCN